jgi:hypothetical protein
VPERDGDAPGFFYLTSVQILRGRAKKAIRHRESDTRQASLPHG